MLIQELQKLGLSDKEAKVYLASLELGPAPIATIAKQASVNRPTTYVIIESLMKKGLLSSFDKGKKTFFSAESPERLLSLLRLKEKETQEQAREFETILPDLKKLYSLAGGTPKVRFFEGKKGIQAIQEDILNTKTNNIKEFVNMDEAEKVFPREPKDYRKKVQMHIKNIQVIYTSKNGAHLPNEEGSVKRRFVPFTKFPFSCDIGIYDNKIALISYTDKIMGVIVENPEIAETLKQFFNLAWDAAKNY